jgi:hypothetical protein
MSVNSSLSILGSHKLAMQQITRMMTIPEVAPMKTRIFVVAFWKENSNRAIKNTKTLNKSIVVSDSSLSVERIDRDNNARPHQQSIR